MCSVYVYTFMYVGAHVHVGAQVCMWRTETNLTGLPQPLSNLFSKTGLSLNLDLTNFTSFAPVAPGNFLPLLPCAGIRGMPLCPAFHRHPDIQKASRLYGQHFY